MYYYILEQRTLISDPIPENDDVNARALMYVC